MLEALTVPRHQILSQGRFSPISDGAIKRYTPKPIDYKHTIRVITPFTCCHQEDIKLIQDQHLTQIQRKDQEIKSLRSQLKEKDREIQKKDQEIEALRETSKRQLSLMKTSLIEKESRLEGSQVTSIFCSTVKSQTEPHFSSIKKSFIFELGPEQQSLLELNRVKEQFQNLENSLKELGGVLNKPKRYQFFTRSNIELGATLPQKIEKLETKPDLTGSELIQDEQINEQQSMSETSANESFDDADFLEQALSEHHILRDTLIALEQQTQAEIQQMKLHYEKEIEEYRRMLQKERDKVKGNQEMGLRDSGKERQQYKNRQQEFKKFLKRPSDGIDSSPIDNH